MPISCLLEVGNPVNFTYRTGGLPGRFRETVYRDLPARDRTGSVLMRRLSAIYALLAWPVLTAADPVANEKCIQLDCSVRHLVDGDIGGHLLIAFLIAFVALVLIARRHGGRSPEARAARGTGEPGVDRKPIVGESGRPNS